MSDASQNEPSRRGFITLLASGITTAGLGILAGWAAFDSAEDVEAAVSVDVEAFPYLSELSGSDADAAPLLNRFLEKAGSRAEIRGRYTIDAPLTLPHRLARLTLAPGSALAVRGSHSAITRSGTITFRERTQRPMLKDAVSFSTPSPELYSRNEYLLLSGDNRVANSRDRYGYLRRVTSIENNTVYLDKALPRRIDAAPRTSSVELAPPVRIDGSGEIYSTEPKRSKNSLVTLRAVDHPDVSGISVHSSGGIGITVAHCRGGVVACTVRDLLDDGKEYFGYGVNVSGSTRELTVAGYMARVRHAVTTNAGGNIKGVGHAGEPEDCTFAPRAENCSNKAVDTHRLGWGITVIPNVTGGNGGVQVRADNTTVRNGSITGSGSGVTISQDVEVSARVEKVVISGTESGIGIRCRGPAWIKDCAILDTDQVAVELSDRSIVDGLSVRRGGAVGVMILGSGNDVSNVLVGSPTTPVLEGADASDNSIRIDDGRSRSLPPSGRRSSRP